MENEIHESGFTLTELIVTITIVGILAAVAVPKLVSLGADARAEVIKSTAGAMKQANEMIFAKASTANIVGLSSGQTGASIVYPAGDGLGGTVTISIHFGFAKNAAELAKALNLTEDVAVGIDSTSYPDGVIQHTQSANSNNVRSGLQESGRFNDHACLYHRGQQLFVS